jgi:tetratricopeptide (TPR) repeat protein
VGALIRNHTWKNLLVGVTVPAAILVVTELVLAAVGVEPLIRREDPTRGFSGLVSVFQRDGDRFGTRELSRQRTFNPQSFLADKPANGFRLFCLGGSSAYGFPWGAEAAFTGLLGDLLAASHPERTVEAINAAGTSYGMHRLGVVARELVRYQPDVFVIYSGHNEFVEPTFYGAVKTWGEARQRTWTLLARWRLYTLIHDLLRDDSPPTGSAATPAFDLSVRRDQSAVFDAAEKAEIVRRFEEGLRDLIGRSREAGVRVVLATVPANLRDWRPQRSIAGAEGGSDDWLDRFTRGGELLESGHGGEAVPLLEEAASIEPGHAGTRFRLARAYEAADRYDEAREAYGRACDLDASPIRRLSAINDAIRRVAAEEEGADLLFVDVERTLETESEHGLIGFNWIEDYVHPTQQGHRRIALAIWDAMERAGWLGPPRPADPELFRRVTARRGEVEAENPRFLYNTAVVLQQQGRAAEAMEEYRRAIDLAPDYDGARLNLGDLLLAAGRVDEAIAQFRAILDHDPDNPDARRNLGAALTRAGRAGEARVELERAVARDPSAQAYNNLGSALEAGGDLDGAIREYREAIRADPEYARAHRNLGSLLQAQARYEEAEEHLREAVRLDPASAAAQNNLGALLRERGLGEEAEVHLRNALRLDPDLAEAHLGLALLLRERGDPEGAAAELEACLRTDPESVAAHNNLGSLLQGAGKLEPALDHFQEALRLQPDSVEARFNVGIVLLFLDRADEARPHLREAISGNVQVRRFAERLAGDLAGSGQPGAADRAAVLEEVLGE